MRNPSKLLSLFFVFMAVVLCSSETQAQLQPPGSKLHNQDYIDYLNYLGSNSTLTAEQMKEVRETMLAINNEARLNPNYRVAQRCTTALQLPSNLEPLIINEDLNKLAQEQAVYQASIGDVTHDNANYRDFGARVDRYLKNHPKPEACAGSVNLGDYPIGWMKSETHYRPTWNLNGDNTPTYPINAVGYGVAKNGEQWYFTAIWSYVADPEAIKKANKDNLAFGKPAKQSSDLDASYAGAGKAVDGNIDANLKMNDAKSSVSHTGNEESPWWEVDLGAVYDIGKVVVWNRQDCCWDRMQNFTVATSTTPFNVQQSGEQLGPFSPWSAQKKDYTVDVNKKGRYVRISLPKDPRNPRRVLNLTEVQVFGKATNQPTSPDPVATKPTTASTGNSSTPPDPFAAKPTPANAATLKYRATMKPGDKLMEGEKVVSSNGKFQLRGTSGGDFVIEEVQSGRVVYTFPLGSPFGARPSVSIFSYNPDGNICIQSTQNKSYCATNGRDAVAPLILNKSDHAELTDDGRFILVNNKGEEIWASAPKAQAVATGGRIRFINKNKDDGLAYPHVDRVYATGSTVYAATLNGLSVSTDRGKSFKTALKVDWMRGVYAVGSTVYVATDGGLHISTDGGNTFAHKTTTNGLGNNAVSAVYALGGTVYAATHGGLSVSTDGGNSFTNKTTADGLGSDNVHQLYAVGNTVYAATDGGLSISTDGGSSFINKTTANGLGSNNVWGVYAVGNTVYVGTDGGGVGISTDGGKSFTNKTTGSNWVREVYAAGSAVYAATDLGLQISTDGGNSFTNYTAADGLGDSAVFGVYAVGSTIYAATSGGVSIGTDGGR